MGHSRHTCSRGEVLDSEAFLPSLLQPKVWVHSAAHMGAKRLPVDPQDNTSTSETKNLALRDMDTNKHETLTTKGQETDYGGTDDCTTHLWLVLQPPGTVRPHQPHLIRQRCHDGIAASAVAAAAAAAAGGSCQEVGAAADACVQQAQAEQVLQDTQKDTCPCLCRAQQGRRARSQPYFLITTIKVLCLYACAAPCQQQSCS